MRPKKLILSAWGPYRDKQEIDFERVASQGIFLITGATGAGKTTIFDAITYALYGNLSGEERDKERNSVRSDFAASQTPTFVELTMEHGGREYCIWRNPEYLRPKKRSKEERFTKEKENAILHYQDGRVLEGVKEVNNALRELLVLDYQQFKKISMIAQGEFARLLVAPPRDKTRIFREIFGTGVYERFTAALGIRSRQLHDAVMAQKHKLEEDIRLLTVGLEKSVWSQEMQQKLHGLTETVYWNYDAISNLLKEMEAEAQKTVAEKKDGYLAADRAVEGLAAQISKEEELQRKQIQLKKVLEEKEQLKAREQEIKANEKKYVRAVNAGFVESAEQLVVQLSKQLNEAENTLIRIVQEQEGLLQEANALEPIVQQAEQLRELLNRAAKLEELEKDKRILTSQVTEKLTELEEGRQKYLTQESLCGEIKREYEEEDHRRKLSAIGLAVTLLETGKPCPVCGSLSHPAPAKMQDDIISEEALQKLKKRADKAEKELRGLYEQVVARKTMAENLQKQLVKVQEEASLLQQRLDEEAKGVGKEYLSMPLESARKQFQHKWERAVRVVELQQEKKRQQKVHEKQCEELKEQKKVAEENYKSALRHYDFDKEEDYLEARLTKEQREHIQQELENYRRRVAANQELYQHLRDTIKSYKPADMKALKSELATVKVQKEETLKEQKSWERALAEVKKTRELMKNKLHEITSVSTQYGYVKDLENMANGNNPQRLVFEQYVLTGYFEEILKAANIRFRKMTSGRFEMSRVGQVGDGRVKDSLEIQVMDYYTGKYRSVRTLSGGESFKASLSLALGMSDVIQALNGGIRVDTLFVDEGFGALDEESLDQACNTLMGLVEKDCLIGIISHVSQLQERISQQLVIEKTSSGSLIRSSVK